MQKKSTYPLLESIGLIDGRIPLLEYHQDRVDHAFQNFWSHDRPHDLASILMDYSLPQKGTYKLRFLYDAKTFELEWHTYSKRIVQSLSLQELPSDYSYAYKYTDREVLKELKAKTHTDEVLFCRKGLLTDAYYFNVIVIKGGHLWTPSTPLLKGCMRSFLLDKGHIKRRQIDLDFLKKSEGVLLINALNPIETAPFIPIQRILLD